MTKKDIRASYQLLRRHISKEQVIFMSGEITTIFFDLLTDLKQQTVHIFLPINNGKEVNTWLIISTILKRFPDIVLVTSRVDYDRDILVHHRISPETKIDFDKWKIPFPVSNVHVHESEIDIVLIPLLAFDSKGHRVGYGKGYYDQFLSRCRPDILKIGVSFFPDPIQIDDINTFDIPMDLCITPESVIRF